MKLLCYFGIVCLISISNLRALPTPTPTLNSPKSAKIYEINSNLNNLIYEWTQTEQIQGNKIILLGSYKDLQGKEVVREELIAENNKVSKYTVTQNQIDEIDSLQILGNEVHFNRKALNDSKEITSKEILPENFAVGPQLIALIRNYWDKLLLGESIKIKFAAIFRSEPIGFTLTKISQQNIQDGLRVKIKMKPTSFLVSAVVDPILLTFEKKTKEQTARIIELEGKTILKKNTQGSWKDLDAHIVYSYE